MFLFGIRPSDNARGNRIVLKCLLAALGLFIAYLGVCLMVTAATAAGRRAGFRYTELDPKVTTADYVHFSAKVRGEVSDPDLGLRLEGVRYRRQEEQLRDGRWGMPVFARNEDADKCQAGSVLLSKDVWVNTVQFQPYNPPHLDGYTSVGPGVFRKGDKKVILSYIPNGDFSFLGKLQNGVLLNATAVPGVVSADDILIKEGVERAEDIGRRQKVGAGLIYLGLFLFGLARGPLTGLLVSGLLATGCSQLLAWL